jgi:hypothetical protein
MQIGQVFRDRGRVKRVLKEGQGVAAVLLEDGRVRIGGEPKEMANSCHEVAAHVLGLKVSNPDRQVVVIVKGGTLCNRSESSILCKECPGLL